MHDYFGYGRNFVGIAITNVFFTFVFVFGRFEIKGIRQRSLVLYVLLRQHCLRRTCRSIVQAGMSHLMTMNTCNKTRDFFLYELFCVSFVLIYLIWTLNVHRLPIRTRQ